MLLYLAHIVSFPELGASGRLETSCNKEGPPWSIHGHTWGSNILITRNISSNRNGPYGIDLYSLLSHNWRNYFNTRYLEWNSLWAFEYVKRSCFKYTTGEGFKFLNSWNYMDKNYLYFWYIVYSYSTGNISFQILTRWYVEYIQVAPS